jgi:hypothetical protein
LDDPEKRSWSTFAGTWFSRTMASKEGLHKSRNQKTGMQEAHTFSADIFSQQDQLQSPPPRSRR